MRSSTLGAMLWASLALAIPQGKSADGSGIPLSSQRPDKNGKFEIVGPNIRAQFVPYGASISNLFIKDISGVERDIVTGFDNASYYSIDKQHPHFGGVPGRYANRIKNSTFTIDDTKYNVLPNEHPTEEYPDGVNQLHGGTNGWDWRNWTVVRHTKDSITFSLVDADGDQGFPGEVVSYVAYSVADGSWDIRMVALATTKRTPIMLSSHTYLNLDGFQNPETDTAMNHSLWLPYAGQRVGVDSILIPTGEILANPKGSVNDFWSGPKQLGAELENPELYGNCGDNCTGYDNCYINNRLTAAPSTLPHVARLHSPWSGIQLDIFTDQPAFQVYTCIGQNGSMALKSTQGLFDVKERPRTIQQYGCVVLEVQDYIDGINHPEWGRESKQVYGPGDDPYVLRAKYVFSLDGKKA